MYTSIFYIENHGFTSVFPIPIPYHMDSSSFFPSLLWLWEIWSSHHQYNHNRSINPHHMSNLPLCVCVCMCVSNLPSSPPTLTLYINVFLIFLGLSHPMLAWLLLYQAPNPHTKLLSLSFPMCGTRTPYSPFPGATSPYQASNIDHLCGCLPHATWALTSSSRPPWAMSCIPYSFCWLATPSQPYADSSLPCTVLLMALGLDYFERKKERRKLFMHFSWHKIIIDLFFHCFLLLTWLITVILPKLRTVSSL